MNTKTIPTNTDDVIDARDPTPTPVLSLKLDTEIEMTAKKVILKMLQKTVRMPKAIADEFQRLLRSGEIRRAYETLKNDKTGGLCCLGVLQLAAGDRDVERDAGGSPLSLPSQEWCVSKGVHFVAVRTNLSPLNPYLPSLGMSAGEANDSKQYDFVAIADAFLEATEFTDTDTN